MTVTDCLILAVAALSLGMSIATTVAMKVDDRRKAHERRERIRLSREQR